MWKRRLLLVSISAAPVVTRLIRPAVAAVTGLGGNVHVSIRPCQGANFNRLMKKDRKSKELQAHHQLTNDGQRGLAFAVSAPRGTT